MQYPAGSMASVGFLNLRYTGMTAFSQLAPLPRRAMHTGPTIKQTTAIPDGYSVGGAWLLPIVGGSRASRVGNDAVSIGTASGAIGLNGSAVSDVVSLGSALGNAIFPGAATGSAISQSTATGIGVAIAAALSGAVSGGVADGVALFSSGALGFASSSGQAPPGAIAWGSAATQTDTLTPEGLAAAVWGALAAQNNSPGTMGDLLNAAGGGGISGAVIDQIAAAVWAWAETVTPGSKGDELAKALRAAKLAAALSA